MVLTTPMRTQSCASFMRTQGCASPCARRAACKTLCMYKSFLSSLASYFYPSPFLRLHSAHSSPFSLLFASCINLYVFSILDTSKSAHQAKKLDMHGIKQKHEDIYKRYAHQYDEFKAKQDHQRNLLSEIMKIVAESMPNIQSQVYTIPFMMQGFKQVTDDIRTWIRNRKADALTFKTLFKGFWN